MLGFFSKISKNKLINCKKGFLAAVFIVLVFLGLKIQAAGEERHIKFILQGFQRALSEYYQLNGHYPSDIKMIPIFLVASAGENFYFDSKLLAKKDWWHVYRFYYQPSDGGFILTASPMITIGLKEVTLTEEGLR